MTHPPLGKTNLWLIETPDDVGEFARWLGERRPVLGLDTETGGLEWNDRLRTVQFGDAMSGWVVDFERWAGLAQWAFDVYKRPMVLHNAGFDIHHLERNGCRVRRELLDDTLIMAHLLDPPGTHALKPLAVKHIDKNADAGSIALHEGMRAQRWTWDTVPIEFEPYWLYSALDPIETARLWELFKPKVDASFASLYDMELAALWPLVDAERMGFVVDAEYAREYRDVLTERSSALYAQAGEEYGVRPGSYEVAQRLLDDGMPLTKLTDAGRFSLDKDVLEGLADKHPLAGIVQQYKQATRFRSAYVDAVLKRMDSNGIVHPRISTLGARTGRMSVSSPPLQQLPSGQRGVRRMFVPRQDRTLVSIDFSNIEVRLLAHFSQDETMLQAFKDGLDVHWEMAQRMFPEVRGLDPDKNPKAKKARKNSKAGTLGKQFGIGIEKFAAQQGVTLEAAREFMTSYEATFPDVMDFLAYVNDIGSERWRDEKRAYVTTPLGREGTLKPGEARNREWYKLVNYLIQGYAADLLKDGLTRLSAAGMCDDRLILPVHDELLLDVPTEDAEDFGREAAAILESVGDGLTVPITCDVELYDESWAQSVP